MTSAPGFTHRYLNLADERLGAKVYFATDDFFAPKERMILSTAPVFIPGKYDENGKWMDGWESRRKRTAGHDYALLSLEHAGRVYGVNIDTTHFTGNNAPKASIDACHSNDLPDENTVWQTVLSPSKLKADSNNYFPIQNNNSFNFFRLNIYPDGGVARLRLYGHVDKSPAEFDATNPVDLIAAINGGRPVAASDEHYGIVANLIAPGKGINMGDGWETARRRSGGHDWAIIALCHPGIVEKVHIDTAYFKGNYPEYANIKYLSLAPGETEEGLECHPDWRPLIDRADLSADNLHDFLVPEKNQNRCTHLRLNIHPDGGISRFRAFGYVQPETIQPRLHPGRAPKCF